MSETLETTNNGKYRLVLHPDRDASNPRKDFDHLVNVITPGQQRYIDVDDEGGPLQYGWDHFSMRPNSEALFIRWARMVHGAVVVEHRPDRGAWGMWYLTPDKFEEVSDPKECIEAEIKDYQSWADGEVYGFSVEQCVEWVRADGEGDSKEIWEDVESCWGYIGYEYAHSAAREEFEPYRKENK